MFVVLAVILGSSPAALSQPTPLKPELSTISFLVGSWKSGTGSVAETGGSARGVSTIAPQAGGSVLLRQDHTDLFAADGEPAGGFDIIMMIYPEGGTLHADYSDGTHIIHYTSATVVPDRSVTFTSAAIASAPTFRLTYERSGDDTLAVRFEAEPPGQTSFAPIASGTMHRTAR